MQSLDFQQRIVHFDLKGAPLKIAYLERVVTSVAEWGATGILLEWEDTFPYSGDLAEIGSLSNAGGDNMYSPAEVQHILQFIKDKGLEPIQLVQTFGHMEFVLKHPKFQELRELDKSPAALCPSKFNSQVLVRNMVNQALEAQPNAKYFHIGADEVWHMAVCAQCIVKATNNKYKEASLYLDHIKDLVLYIKEKRPDITVLMWDDMLRKIPINDLQDYKLGELVVIVVWDYTSNVVLNVREEILETYAPLFPQIFFGTAYKGATGSCQISSDIARYLSNHQTWIDFAKANINRIKFCGTILTGWSRYDHYATLCELLPVSMPTLAVCLKVLVNPYGGLTTLDLNGDADVAGGEDPIGLFLSSADWPGEKVAACVRSFLVARDRALYLLSSDIVKTWLNPWQVSRRYTMPSHINGIWVAAQHSLAELALIKADMFIYLNEVTGDRSTEEWIMTNIEPMINKMSRLNRISGERSLAEIGDFHTMKGQLILEMEQRSNSCCSFSITRLLRDHILKCDHTMMLRL